MDIIYVKCPACAQKFHCDANLIGLPIPLHCPHCDLYFEPREDEGKKPTVGTAFMGLSKIDRKTIYLPPAAKSKARK